MNAWRVHSRGKDFMSFAIGHNRFLLIAWGVNEHSSFTFLGKIQARPTWRLRVAGFELEYSDYGRPISI